MLGLASGMNAVCSFFSFHYYYHNAAIYAMLKGLPKGAVFIISVVNSEYMLRLLAGKSSVRS